MSKPTKFSYQKKAPYRDASLFIIICEGKNREPEYFRYFDGISSRIKVIAVESDHGSAPKLLAERAAAKEKELDSNDNTDYVWFVIDTDRWGKQLHDIREECKNHPNWRVAQSNPCFEVWLYFHVKDQLPELVSGKTCKSWKSLLPRIIKGGFNAQIHPIEIETAIKNAKGTYLETGYLPDWGSTQVWKLGEELLPFIKTI